MQWSWHTAWITLENVTQGSLHKSSPFLHDDSPLSVAAHWRAVEMLLSRRLSQTPLWSWRWLKPRQMSPRWFLPSGCVGLGWVVASETANLATILGWSRKPCFSWKLRPASKVTRPLRPTSLRSGRKSARWRRRSPKGTIWTQKTTRLAFNCIICSTKYFKKWVFTWSMNLVQAWALEELVPRLGGILPNRQCWRSGEPLRQSIGSWWKSFACTVSTWRRCRPKWCTGRLRRWKWHSFPSRPRPVHYQRRPDNQRCVSFISAIEAFQIGFTWSLLMVVAL